MADNKAFNAAADETHYEKGPSQEQGRRRSSVAALQQGKNLDAV